MKKIFLNESEKRKLILEKEKLIMESFAKTFNKIKRIDENEISTNIGVNPSPNYSNNNWNKAIVKIGDKITVSNLPDGEPTRGYENIKIGDVLTITNVRRNANGIVYDTDFSPEYGIGNDDIQSFTNKFQGIDENEILDEGLKQWIAGGLIALTTLGGVGKIYQLNQEKAANQQIEMKYYNDVLSDTVSKMSKEDLSKIGGDINEKTRDIALAREFSGEELTSVFSNYASKYIQGHAKEFGINANGGIQWLGTK